jgi:hypothetical protein
MKGSDALDLLFDKGKVIGKHKPALKHPRVGCAIPQLPCSADRTEAVVFGDALKALVNIDLAYAVI